MSSIPVEQEMHTFEHIHHVVWACYDGQNRRISHLAIVQKAGIGPRRARLVTGRPNTV